MGIVLYVYFLAVGFLYADMLFKEKDIYFRIWIGSVFGNVLLMAGIMPFAAVFGFTKTAHFALAAAVILPYAVIKAVKKEKINIKIGGEECVPHKAALFLVLPVTLVIWVLMTNHILAPFPDGGVSSGQSTYGDLNMHLSFVTSIAEQGKFPPEYCQLSGYKLNYPFLADMLSSSLYLFGTGLRWAVLVPSYVMSLLLVAGFYILARKITNRKAAAVLAVVLFFFNGGFGFAYFLNGARADGGIFTQIFTEYYKTPTNYLDGNLRWVNTICDMIIPQRTTMAGWCVLMPALWLLTDGIRTKSVKTFAILGVLAGCMPMIHTHTFLALGVISAVLCICSLVSDFKANFKMWAVYGITAVVLALPQLIFWTFSQTSGNDSFLRLSFNWVNTEDPYLWFYLKNWGITALFIVPAVICTGIENKKLALGGAAVMVLAELVLFQPNSYDNNKLIFIAYMIAVILVSEYFVKMYEKLKGTGGRAYLAAAVVFFGTFSGALTIAREYKSGREYQTFTEEDIQTAKFIRENTEKDAVFLTGGETVNPVSSLGGRNLFLGSSFYVYFHGFGEEYAKRSELVKAAYENGGETLAELCSYGGIKYVFVGRYERDEFNINEENYSNFDKIYSKGGNTLYKIK